MKDTYKSVISNYCFIRNTAKPQDTKTICSGVHNVTLTGLASNVHYNVSAFVVTKDGRHSSPSNVVNISTKPSAVKAITTSLSQGITSSAIPVTKVGRTSTVSSAMGIGTTLSNTKDETTSGSQDSPASATVIPKDLHKSPIHTAARAITSQSDINTSTNSGSLETRSGSVSAAIGAVVAVAVLLMLVAALILLWKFKMIPLKHFQGTRTCKTIVEVFHRSGYMCGFFRCLFWKMPTTSSLNL